ncbi:MAG: amino acid ABC transporter permease [Alphaproteobacteria bacterium]
MGPIVAVVASLLTNKGRSFVVDRFGSVCMGIAGLAFIGFMLPIQAWNPVAGSSPPWVMAISSAAFAYAAISPWGYDKGAGLAGRIALLLAPFYLIVAYLVLAGPPDALNFGIFDWQANTVPFFRGVQEVLPFVETSRWGGLMLTLVIAVTGIVASLPLGIVLALGRRSNMPVIRTICIVFIEFWRGVPLITVLFMASVMFPLFLPEGVTFNQLLRALIGVALFSSAYMAEVIRGGLQAIPKGQYEAADAMGLSYWSSMRLIILPQALKIVIPGIVNTFIGLFKDTTLVSIIGLFDLLNIVQTGLTDANWLAPNVPYTGYVFAAFGFWIFCYSMSRYSQMMERKLDTGHRN